MVHEDEMETKQNDVEFIAIIQAKEGRTRTIIIIMFVERQHMTQQEWRRKMFNIK